MSLAEFVWIFAPLVTCGAALFFFARKRRTTIDFAQARAFKAAVPWWVGTVERLVALVCASLLAIGAWEICERLLGLPPPGPITSPRAIYVLLGIGAIILPLALLCANLVSWIVRPLRSANQRALHGNGLSFGTLNLGLLKFALVCASVGLLLIGIAAVRPWSG